MSPNSKTGRLVNEAARSLGPSTGTVQTGEGLAGFLVRLMLAAVRAQLLDLETIGIVAAILLRDVVTVLAHLAGQGDLWPDVS